MTTHFKRCTSDEELGKVSLFLFERKYDLHPSFTTMEMIPLLYSYLTEGYLIQGVNEEGSIVAASAYYIGTPEQEYKDIEIAFVDVAIVDQSQRSTRVFYKGTKYLAAHIMKEHPDVKELRFAALSENTRLCRLYSKFSQSSYEREGRVGQETVFCEKIDKIFYPK